MERQAGQCSIPRIPLRNEIRSDSMIGALKFVVQLDNNPVAQNCGPNHKKNGPNL